MAYRSPFSDKEFSDYLRLLNAFFDPWRWQETKANKDHDDEFGDKVIAGDFYYKRDCGQGWDERLKLSKRSMDTFILLIFHNNPLSNQMGNELLEHRFDKLRKATESMPEIMNPKNP